MSQPSDTGSAAERELVELMVAYQRGDLAAFERLHALLTGDVRRYFSRAPQQRRVVQDLTQDTFLEMHRSRRTYTPPLPVRPWIFGIARNVLARSRRAAPRADVSRSLEVESDGVLASPAHSAHPGEALDIENALARLPASAREPWLLHHVFGFSFQSIAARLGITEMAAKLRSSRATRALRAALRAAPEAADE